MVDFMEAKPLHYDVTLEGAGIDIDITYDVVNLTKESSSDDGCSVAEIQSNPPSSLAGVFFVLLQGATRPRVSRQSS